jgi:hypothetical protein
MYCANEKQLMNLIIIKQILEFNIFRISTKFIRPIINLL